MVVMQHLPGLWGRVEAFAVAAGDVVVLDLSTRGAGTQDGVGFAECGELGWVAGFFGWARSTRYR